MKKASLMLILISSVFACLMLVFFFFRMTHDGKMTIHTKDSLYTQTQTLNGSAPSGLIDINTATAEELQELPGIGESLAERIIDYRTTQGPFERKSDLKNVKGIGESVYKDLESMITVENNP